VQQGSGKQGSDKQCRLTQQGIRKLEDALKIANGGVQPSNIWIADTYGIDRGTVAEVINRQKPVTRRSIEKLFNPLDLDLLPEDYEFCPNPSKKPKSSQPNPFEQTGLWGCDELLRRIFEQLGKGGSQALIGPAGCGKSEILRAIGQQGPARLGRSERAFLYIDMNYIRDESGLFDELGDLLGFGVFDQNQLRRRLMKTGQPYVLCLDAMHVLMDEAFFPASIRNWLRGMAEIPNSPLQLVVASQRSLRELFPDSSLQTSQLADFFSSQTYRLEYWSLAEVKRFLEEHLRGTGIIFSNNQIFELSTASNGKPKEVKRMAGELYQRIFEEADS
jgi:energy-coupling factor transporter ATP-binding protein EcfA2